jgi:drug/metabolite transporter (DMT)-like permease
MEIWFYLALASAVAGGIGAFTSKVVAVRNADIAVLNTYASVISAAILFCCTWYFAGFASFWALSTVVAFVGAATYLFTLILKVSSLREIDSAIFFPLYKVSGPLFAIILGIIFFSESFSRTEWMGLTFSLLVPLMLITRSENMRQKNLARGIYLLLAAAVIGSISIALFKYGTDITHNVWLYLLVSDLFLAFSSVLVLLRKYKSGTLAHMKSETTPQSLKLVGVMGLAQASGAATMIFAFAAGGALGIVYTINSLYILIPIILSIIFYNEHWNLRKAIAILLSMVALALLR